jgi:MtN3 and saliva related transmembrane protein
MTIDWVTVIGTLGASASVASFTPQAWKIIRERSTKGLSLGMFSLTSLAFAAWTTFGVLKSEWALIIPNAICLIFALFILGMIAMPQRQTEKVAEAIDPED